MGKYRARRTPRQMSNSPIADSNGLQITGELNDETIRSLRTTASATPSPSDRAYLNRGRRQIRTSDLRDEPAAPNAGAPVRPLQPFNQMPPTGNRTRQRKGFTPSQMVCLPGLPMRRLLPTATESASEMRNVAWPAAAFSRARLTVSYGTALEFSLRAYQTRPDWRLWPAGCGDTGCPSLAAGRSMRYGRLIEQGEAHHLDQPPVRGEWVRP